jgi:hypothetical protein
MIRHGLFLFAFLIGLVAMGVAGEIFGLRLLICSKLDDSFVKKLVVVAATYVATSWVMGLLGVHLLRLHLTGNWWDYIDVSKVGIVQSQSEALVQDARKGLEPRWPAAIALLAVGGLRLALPGSLSAGPSWMLLVVVGMLMVPIVWAYYCGFDALHGILGYVVTSVVTADMVWSLFLLIAAIPAHKELPQDMLRSAAALWITNVLVFASCRSSVDCIGAVEHGKILTGKNKNCWGGSLNREDPSSPTAMLSCVKT